MGSRIKKKTKIDVTFSPLTDKIELNKKCISLVKQWYSDQNPEGPNHGVLDYFTIEEAVVYINELPQKYKTSIGERGVRLSGGQRQRIGIARALYHDPRILIFDEATSALDNRTEAEVMEAIESLDRQITVILIAHRLSTVQRCDRILLLEQGRIAGFGTYAELLAGNGAFQRLASERPSLSS